MKIPMTLITEIEKIKPKFHLEAPKISNNPGHTEQKDQC
jgi:hypothetical protein